MTDLDTSNDFVHEFRPLVLVLHLLQLVPSGEPGHDRVDGDGQDHDGHARENGGTQLLVHEVTAERDLQRSRPDGQRCFNDAHKEWKKGESSYKDAGIK